MAIIFSSSFLLAVLFLEVGKIVAAMVVAENLLKIDTASPSIKPSIYPSILLPCSLPSCEGGMVPFPSRSSQERGVDSYHFYSSTVKVTYIQSKKKAGWEWWSPSPNLSVASLETFACSMGVANSYSLRQLAQLRPVAPARARPGSASSTPGRDLSPSVLPCFLPGLEAPVPWMGSPASKLVLPSMVMAVRGWSASGDPPERWRAIAAAPAAVATKCDISAAPTSFPCITRRRRLGGMCGLISKPLGADIFPAAVCVLKWDGGPSYPLRWAQSAASWAPPHEQSTKLLRAGGHACSLRGQRTCILRLLMTRAYPRPQLGPHARGWCLHHVDNCRPRTMLIPWSRRHSDDAACCFLLSLFFLLFLQPPVLSSTTSTVQLLLCRRFDDYASWFSV